MAGKFPFSRFTYAQLAAIPANRAICDYLDRYQPSAHSDVGSELFDAADGLDCQFYSPNIQAYRYIVLHTAPGVIFAGAFGMNACALRLPVEAHAGAIREDGKPFSELTPEWIEFDPFRPNVKTVEMRERLKRWCATAFDHAIR